MNQTTVFMVALYIAYFLIFCKLSRQYAVYTVQYLVVCLHSIANIARAFLLILNKAFLDYFPEAVMGL